MDSNEFNYRIGEHYKESKARQERWQKYTGIAGVALVAGGIGNLFIEENDNPLLFSGLPAMGGVAALALRRPFSRMEDRLQDSYLHDIIDSTCNDDNE